MLYIILFAAPRDIWTNSAQGACFAVTEVATLPEAGPWSVPLSFLAGTACASIAGDLYDRLYR